MLRRNFLAASAAAAATTALPFAASAQSQHRIIVGFAAGGPGDTLARVVAEHLRRSLGTVLVENKPGAAGRIAFDALKAAEPDGGTLLNSPSSLLTLTPHAFPAGTYQPLKDVAPVGTLAELDFALVVGPQVQARTMAEFIQFCRANPKLASYGTAGAGTPQHMVGAMLSRSVGIELTHVAYRGGAPALQDVIGGTLPACVTSLGEVMIGAAREGRLRILATTGTRRSSFLPNVPTLSEEGMKGVVASDWTGLLAPARTPPQVLARLDRVVGDMARDPEFKTALARFYMEPLAMDAATYRSRLDAEYAAWGPIVKATGFTMDR